MLSRNLKNLNNTNKVKPFFSFLLMVYMFISTINYAFGFGVPLFNYSLIKYIPILLFIISFFITIIFGKVKQERVLISSIVFAVFVCLRVFFGIIVEGTGNSIIETIFVSLSWFFCFYFSFLLLRKDFGTKHLSYISFSLIIVFSLIYLSNVSRIDYSNPLRPMAVNSVYYLLALLPFVFLSKEKFLRIISILFCLVTIIASSKATAFAALVVSLLLYYSFQKKIGMKAVVTLVVVVIVIIFATSFSDFLSGINIFKKFQSANETGAVGRFEIYSNVLENFFSQSFARLLMGNGYNGVNKYLGSTAHNDFLEVLFDYGIVGALLYIAFYLSIFLRIKNLFKKNAKYSREAIMMFSIVVTISLTSELIFVPRYFLLMIFFLGLTLNNNVGRRWQ